jgi:hypothetical protein
MIIAHCSHLQSIQRLYTKERELELNSSRSSLADLDLLIRKERTLNNKMIHLVHRERYCNSINWGFTSNYNWRK